MPEVVTQYLNSGWQHLQLHRNPVVWKNFKARLRTQAVFQFLLVFIIAGFITVITYAGLDEFQASSIQAARVGVLPLLILQSVILMLSGTGRVTSGVIHERVTGTLDYTRMTPMSPMTKVMGYLFGLPVREYLLFAMTMPFMLFLLIMGEIPWSSTIQVYLVFFSSVFLYHLIGLVFGLVLKEWRMSVVFTQGVVILINLILPLFSNLGFPFLQYLTIRPVVISQIVPLLPQGSDVNPVFFGGMFTTDVAFFNWSVSTTMFSLLVQGMLIFTLGLMVYRKWQSAFNKSLGKIYAIVFFLGLQLFCVGTMWPNLTGATNSDLARGLLPSDFGREELSYMLPLMFSIFTQMFLFWLLYVITPTHDEYRSGLILDRKLRQGGGRGLPPFHDKSSAVLTASILAAMSFAFIVFIQSTLSDVGAYSGISFFSLDFLRMPLTTVLVIFYFFLALENLEFPRLAIMVLILWILPILLAILAGVAFGVEYNWAYIASVSPFALMILSMAGLYTDTIQGEEQEYLMLFRQAYWLGSAVIFYITCYMGYELTLVRKRIRQGVERSSQ